VGIFLFPGAAKNRARWTIAAGENTPPRWIASIQGFANRVRECAGRPAASQHSRASIGRHSDAADDCRGGHPDSFASIQNYGLWPTTLSR